MFPDDRDRGVPCQVTPKASHKCNSVDGELTAITDQNDVAADRTKIMNALEEGVKQNAFNSAHPSIVRVSMVETWKVETSALAAHNDTDTVPANATNDKTISSESEDGLENYLIWLIAVGATLVLLLLLLLILHFSGERRSKSIAVTESTASPKQNCDTSDSSVGVPASRSTNPQEA